MTAEKHTEGEPSEQAEAGFARQQAAKEVGGDFSAFESMADSARTHAADVFRRGTMMEDAHTDGEASGDDRLIALLCYWSQIVMPLVMPVIVLLSESGKRRPFQRHHAMQSLGLVGAFIALAVAVVIGAGVLQVVPVVGFLVGVAAICLSPIAYFMGVIALLMYGWQAHKGKRFAIPGLTGFLREQGWLD